ncbi:DUF3043 domain-containing protein [Rathayibacter iranicus]|uniref:DUF3043 domain-containing protein n=1 Tax=Rathayibacter iranicus TaxID=59737 RepID=A0AAD1ELC0_9MICO|nr:DUF3043 domain-containing protein [Rathayibacter iranicus]MWV31446.1 DUF3043 domain-containing protein [Rathayibacter iranicus NCPPB 2253 = VKM Ac-1602]PPI50281.1 DUF3043 domain-containing protein [Rathayibacter iranicus]PPI62494.1 DUF3043 domain-containing protein [Rathayibacter iranicus]PPI73553.1 DUF3043 domain-containing protein [Rathayibacter iranicus]
MPDFKDVPVAKHPIATDTPDDANTPGIGKGRPTPTRREQELARKRPLVVTDRKQAARDAREKAAVAREQARLGLAAGDQRYLPLRDRGPQRKFIRDWVDARFSLGEFLIPVMVIVLLLSFFPQPELQSASLLIIWVFFLIAVIDCIFLGTRMRRKLAERFGADKVEKGVRWYAATRALQLRVMRLPKPQVKRGAFPE